MRRGSLFSSRPDSLRRTISRCRMSLGSTPSSYPATKELVEEIGRGRSSSAPDSCWIDQVSVSLLRRMAKPMSVISTPPLRPRVRSASRTRSL